MGQNRTLYIPEMYIFQYIGKSLLMETLQKSGYDQEMPLSHTASQRTAQRGGATKH